MATTRLPLPTARTSHKAASRLPCTIKIVSAVTTGWRRQTPSCTILPGLITPSSDFFSPSFQPVPDLNIGLYPAPMLYLRSEMHNPSRPRGPSAFDALPLPEPSQSVPLAASAASPVDLRTIARFASQNLLISSQPILDQLLTPTPVIHTPLGFCVTKAPVAEPPVLNRFGGGGPRYAANPGLTPSFRRSLPETGSLFECISMALLSGSPERKSGV